MSLGWSVLTPFKLLTLLVGTSIFGSADFDHFWTENVCFCGSVFVRNRCIQPEYWVRTSLSQKWNVEKLNNAQFSEKNPRKNFRNNSRELPSGTVWLFFGRFLANFSNVTVLKAYFEKLRGEIFDSVLLRNFQFSSSWVFINSWWAVNNFLLVTTLRWL